jgi:hypothetical protein
MLTSVYAEDLFESFYELCHSENLPCQQQDLAPMDSFYLKILNQEPLTQNQANFLLKLLEKYKTIAAMAGLDYTTALSSIQWKQPFRVLDLSKKIYVNKDNKGQVWVCLRFPYQLKKEFDAEIHGGLEHHKTSFWDPDNKVRCLSLYDFNLVQLYEFAQKHNFEIDDTFMIALSDVEEIWQNAEQVLPFATAENDTVFLNNATEDAGIFWNRKAVGSYGDNLLLAKSMGYLYQGQPTNSVETIAASSSNSFWIKTNKELFSLYNSITGKLVVVLDRTGNTLSWLDHFVRDADAAGVPRSDIRVCFRESKNSDTGINGWIKHNDVGGKVDDGKILIFEYKPAKWLFKNVEDVKMLVTNNLYPPTSQITKDWFESHPCVIYLGDIKPSEKRGQQIVEL